MPVKEKETPWAAVFSNGMMNGGNISRINPISGRSTIPKQAGLTAPTILISAKGLTSI